jgi:VIT1/CCC1 family predicted Fe2+/Mn2+ transporter
VTAGLAAALSTAVSMAAVAYTSAAAKGALFRSERAREYRHIDTVPSLERAEVREIYAKKGFTGELLDRIVETITRDRDVWVAVMMAEEHGLSDVDSRVSLRSAAMVGASSLTGSLIPLVPFALFAPAPAAWASVALSLAALAAFGAYKAVITVGSPWRSGAQLAALGAATAFVGYAVGALLHVPTT